MNARTPACATVVILTAACSGDATPDREAVAVRDSAGITIIENTRPAWAGNAGWHIAPEPVVSIGAVEGDRAYLFDRVVGALRMSDDRIVVLERGSQELRFYDAEGRHLHNAGGRGAGPGEFQAPTGLYRMPDDSLFVVDPQGGRYTVMDRDGQYARSYAWQGSPTGRLADGRLVFLSPEPQDAATAAPGHVRVPLRLRLSAPDGAGDDTVAVLPGHEEFRAQVAEGMMVFEAPFGKRQELFVAGDRIYSGASDSFEIEVRGGDGSIERLVRADIATRSVSQAHVDAWRQPYLEQATSERFRPAIEALLGDAPIPSMMPPYSGLRVDVEGNLWARIYALPTEPGVEWQVFDSTGRWLGPVDMPEGLEVMDIGSDYVLGVFRDAVGVEYVRLYPVQKVGR